MTSALDLTAIRRWFSAHRGGGLILPDGWFGRPFDNEHHLTGLEARGDELVISLDDRLVITVRGATRVTVGDAGLEIGPCTGIHFEWDTYDDPPHHESSDYASGSVRFVPFPV